MKNVYKLFGIWKRILKVQKLYEIEKKECYKIVLEDLIQQREEILNCFEKNYMAFHDVVKRIEKKYGYTFQGSLLANLITNQNLPTEVLFTFSSLQSIWEFFECQAFSALNFEEALSVKNISYFREYIEAFLSFKNWEYQVSQTYLDMTSTLKDFFSPFVQANDRFKMPIFKQNEKSFEMEMNVLKKLYKKLVQYNIGKTEHEEFLLLFEACLKNFPESYLIDIWNELQSYFFTLDLADVYEKYFHEVNSILLKYKVGSLEYEDLQEADLQNVDFNGFEYYQNVFLMDIRYSYKDIVKYHNAFLQLENLELHILHVYQRLMMCKLHSEQDTKKSFYQNVLKSLLEQEKNFYTYVDFVEFQNYLRIIYNPKINYFPFMFLDLLPNGDEKKEKEFVLHRMINYEIDALFTTLSSVSFSEPGTIQVLEEIEVEPPDMEMLQKFLFSLTSFVLDKISKDEFLKELEKIGFNFEEQFEYLKEEQIAFLWQYIEKNFLNILLKNGEQELVWYYMFFKNKEMEYLVQKDFNCMLTINDSFNAVFYPILRKFLIEDLQRTKKEISNSDDARKKKLFSYYLESCLTFFKDKDKAKFQKIREIVRKK